MGGRSRAFQAFAITLSFSSLCLTTYAVAQGDTKSQPIDQRVYKSEILENEFLRACVVVVRVDGEGDPQALPGELELVGRNRKKTRFYTAASVPITLKQTTIDKTPQAGEAPSMQGETYSVVGIPDDMIKSDQSVTLKIGKSKGEKEIAELTVCKPDGNGCRRIALVRVVREAAS
jgi:hypothetical protein